ncbi:hypothetical protein RJ640_018192 [Escallonia rubra]|uniref:Alpha/beta hydrolase fold-3 domain-containing protein n=1 Tax=Escallonia rubra TaxID=112253 RepID=A0AA88UAZ2_9ASTE|nr:hypothetical protein RJ640_018192 [Escallonia rubra]
MPVILQFHGGGFVSGSSDSVGNDLFCMRVAKLCDAIVVTVGYRLAPESKYPTAFEDGVKHPEEWRLERFLDENNDSVDLYKMMAFGGRKRAGSSISSSSIEQCVPEVVEEN